MPPINAPSASESPGRMSPLHNRGPERSTRSSGQTILPSDDVPPDRAAFSAGVCQGRSARPGEPRFEPGGNQDGLPQIIQKRTRQRRKKNQTGNHGNILEQHSRPWFGVRSGNAARTVRKACGQQWRLKTWRQPCRPPARIPSAGHNRTKPRPSLLPRSAKPAHHQARAPWDCMARNFANVLNSSPIENIRKATPNSASVSTSAVSDNSFRPCGPSAIPMAR